MGCKCFVNSSALLSAQCVSAGLLVAVSAFAQSSVPQLRFGPNGLTSLTYGGTELLGAGEPRLTQLTFVDRSGATRAGDVSSTLTVDAAQQQITRLYGWGETRIKYAVSAGRIDITAAVTNNSSDTIQGLALELLTLKLPAKPREYDGNTPILFHNIGGPTVLPLSWGSGMLVLANEDVSRPLLTGFPGATERPVNTSFPVILQTGKITYSDRLPFIDRPVAPGSSEQFQLSIRFGPDRSSLYELASDVYRRFAGENPFYFGWSDRRPIGSLFLATSSAGWATNPRGWLLDPALNTQTPEGRAEFARRILAFADESINELREMNAQGMIVWDLEGQENPHPVSYVGDPRLIGLLAPEMESVVDEFFRKFTEAGLRVGITVRPQTFVPSADGRPAAQVESRDVAQTLIEKIDYAKRRWGASLFYIDSNGDPSLPIDAKVLLGVNRAHQDVLLSPEHENLRYFTFSAPYNELRGGVASTPAPVRATYPTAFSFINTADGPIEERYSELIEAVKGGDILLFRGWYPDPANRRLKSLYRYVPDNVAPSVALSNVGDGTRLSGAANLTATASDNLGIGRVDFLIDGVPIGHRELSYPYAISWNSSDVANGAHTLTVSAEDLAGNRASASVAIEVANEAHPTCPEITRDRFTACYYSDRRQETLAFARTEEAIAYDWGIETPLANPPDGGFSAVWQGSFVFDRAQYSFQPTFVGAASLYIDGELVWKADSPDSGAPRDFLRRMSPGTHLIRVVYSSQPGPVSARLFWTRT